MIPRPSHVAVVVALALIAPVIARADDPKAADDSKADAFVPDPAWKPLGSSLWFDPRDRRLIMRARVALREGYLEHLLCLQKTKEHESILATDAKPRMIHAGLILAGAKEGHPVRFDPKFEPPTGTPIEIIAEWTDADGNPQKADARTWVKERESGKTLETRWVFAGSNLVKAPQGDGMIYGADSGDLFTVSNFMNAILDLPFASSADDTSRSFVANTEKIPPKGTPVTLILTPATPSADAAK